MISLVSIPLNRVFHVTMRDVHETVLYCLNPLKSGLSCNPKEPGERVNRSPVSIPLNRVFHVTFQMRLDIAGDKCLNPLKSGLSCNNNRTVDVSK